jgi:hypothetical protein
MNVRIILNLILTNRLIGRVLDLSGSGYSQVAGSCEQWNRHSISLKGEEFDYEEFRVLC